jgi:quercetin dioxygenase-like cupin family protein
MTTTPVSSKNNYSVKNIETVVKGTDVVARVFTLASGDCIPWHYHSESHDHYFILQGELILETQEPEGRYIISMGERHQIAPGVKHFVSNISDTDTTFLLIQGVGKYDWLKA